MSDEEDRLSPKSQEVISDSIPGRMVEEVEKNGKDWYPRWQGPRCAGVSMLPSVTAER
jgi:hypothetical protein